MLAITPQECSRIAQDLQIRKVQVEAVVQLLDEANTVPFITRYRKERTGGLNEDVIRQIQLRVQFLRQLHDRKQTILKTIANQNRLTDELKHAILSADTTKRLEDLYLPYKPKKRSLASTARERGLEPLALAIWHSDPAAHSLDEMLPSLVNPEKELHTVDDVRTGVGHILAEMMAESAEVRAPVRSVLWETGNILATRSEKLQEGQGNEFKNYFQFKESVRQIPPHRILALNRGEKEHALKVSFEWARDRIQEVALRGLAELLLKRAGQMPLPASPTPVPPVAPAMEAPSPSGETPSAEQAAVVSPSTEGFTPGTAPEEAKQAAPPAPESAPAAPEGSDAAPVPEAAPAAPAESATPSASSVAGTPEAEAAPAASAESAPLVAALPTLPPPVLVGEVLTPLSDFRSPHTILLKAVLEDALQRLLLPSLEREIRNELTEEAEHHAVQVFARNLRSLLLQPPLRGKRVLAIDPGFRTGCKVAALDEYGNLLEHGVIYPFAPPPKKGKERKPKGESPPPAPPASPAAGEASVPPAAPAPDATPVSEVTPAGEPAPAVAQVTTEPSPTTSPVAPESSAVPESAPAAPSVETPTAEAPTTETTSVTTPAELASVEIQATPAPSGEAAPAAAAPAEQPAPPPVDPRIEAKARLLELLHKHQLQVIALGNGTGCRETEEIVADLIASSAPEVAYIVVNEAGASVYSTSPVGREEFPNFDATTRGTISIGRRLQDPLSELVKVDPQNIGVGLYQHDMSRKELKESLEAVVESCVNQVGVDLNTASVPLLRHISGLNQLVARELVDYRKQHGAFSTREQLMQVPNFGPARFTQAAGFLKIPSAGNPLDRTWIHPESYPIAEKLLAELGTTPAVLDDKAAQDEFHAKLRGVNVEEMGRKIGAGIPTLQDILQALLKPGRDPREDLPPPIFKKGILRLEDLQPNMELRGTVLNVVDFGAFVDIGLKDSGLVHISQMANRYIKSPYDVVAVNDVVTVWVKSIDAATRHVSLTMIKPGTEQKPQERRQGGGERRPPRGGRPGPRQQGEGAPAQGGAPAESRGPREGSRGPGRGPRPPHGPGPGRGGPQGGGGPRREPRESRPASPPQPPPPPPRPRREPPKPKLSKEALEGKVPLRTFRELSALFAAKSEPPPAPPPPAPPQPAASEAVAPAAPAEAPSAPPEPPAAITPESPPQPPSEN